MNYNETAKINKVTILCHGIISGIISAAYLLEVLKGSRTFLYFALIALLSLIPVVAEYMLYRKKPGSDIIRSFVACSYALLYAVAVFTAAVYLHPANAYCNNIVWKHRLLREGRCGSRFD